MAETMLYENFYGFLNASMRHEDHFTLFKKNCLYRKCIYFICVYLNSRETCMFTAHCSVCAVDCF